MFALVRAAMFQTTKIILAELFFEGLEGQPVLHDVLVIEPALWVIDNVMRHM